MPSSDEAFLAATADRLAALPRVRAVSLGGSRAQGSGRPDSDWDFAIYYEGEFDPEHLRGIGWPGYVSRVGEWGDLFNGGAWLTIDSRRTDIHYRDLDLVDRQLEEARAGRFRIEPLMFHLAGIPTYLVVAELALGRVLRGELPRPTYPEALQRAAPPQMVGPSRADVRLRDRRARPATPADRMRRFTRPGRRAIGWRRAGRAWPVGDKRQAPDTRAGLRAVDAFLSDLSADPNMLINAGQAALKTCHDAVRETVIGAAEP